MSENSDYPIDIKTDVPYVLRRTDADTPAPPPVNGGLFSGPQDNSPWMPKAVVPTTTYLSSINEKYGSSSSTRATEQYTTENRLGNNYTAMPGVNCLIVERMKEVLI